LVASEADQQFLYSYNFPEDVCAQMTYKFPFSIPAYIYIRADNNTGIGAYVEQEINNRGNAHILGYAYGQVYYLTDFHVDVDSYSSGDHIFKVCGEGAHVSFYIDNNLLSATDVDATWQHGGGLRLSASSADPVDTLIVTDTGNHSPQVGAVSLTSNPVQINNSTTASASFTDADTADTHTASWDWGDGSSPMSGTVSESNGSGSVTDSHTYTAAGVYVITLTVTDNHGASNTPVFQYVSVYDATAQGLFSAGQKYTSPAGAYAADTNLTGNVKFGLSYKYAGSVPTGNREFKMDFNIANLHFDATSVNSLVISNGIGSLTGSGTINGSGTYDFLVTGKESTDAIRIQITDPGNSNAVIYDTQPGAASNATPTTSVTHF
jgi:PKD repeat protein